MTNSCTTPKEWHELIHQHACSFLGQPSTVYTPHDRTHPLVSVAEFPPRSGQRAWTYVTYGMASARQHIPQNGPDWLSARVELLCYAPERCRWPVEVLNLLGRLPTEQKSWLFWWHTVDCGGPLDEREETNLSAVLLLPPYFERHGFDDLQTGDETIRFLMAVPITESERQLGLARGGQALEELLLTEHVDVVFDGQRSSIV